MKIYQLDRWNSMNENRISEISLDKFKELLKYCHDDLSKFFYKKILDSDLKSGIFLKGKKKRNEVENELIEKIKKTSSLPAKEDSLVFYNYIEKEDEGTLYIVFPFKKALIVITPNEQTEDLDNLDSHAKGYWDSKIKWYEQQKKEKEFWFDSPSLLIEFDIWNTIKHTITTKNKKT